MSAEHVRRTLESYLEALSARADYSRFFADDITFEVLWSDTSARGPQEVEQAIRFLHEIAFDAAPEVLGIVVGEDGAAVEFAFVGTHIGDFGGVEPRGNSVRVPYSAFYEVADGRITALRVYLPVSELVAQARGDAALEGSAPSGAK